MTGRTNYDVVSNGDAMQGPAQITEVYEHFDPLIGESVPTPGDLPATGLSWDGRTIFVDSEQVHYTYIAAITGWRRSGIGQWIAYTPTLVGITLGTGGSIAAKYRYEGQRIRVKGVITLGSSGASVGTLPTMSLPVAAEPNPIPVFQYDGIVVYYDTSAAGAGSYNGQIGAPNGDNTKIRFLAQPTSGTGLVNAVTAGAPFAWTNGDLIWFDFAYAI